MAPSLIVSLGLGTDGSKVKIKKMIFSGFAYPEVWRDESCIENYHGKEIKDPYRWLENVDSEEVKAFVKAQNKLTIPYLEECPFREHIFDHLTKLSNYPKYSCPFKIGERYFFFKNSGQQNQMVLYKQDSLDSIPVVFLDPNELCHDGNISLHSYSFSENGETLAYGLSQCGSDWFIINFKNVSTGSNYDDKLEKVKFSTMAWTHDDLGIFYSCYSNHEGKVDGTETSLNEHQRVFFHKLGTPQADDVLIAEFPEHPRWRINCFVSHCGNYLIICPWETCKNNLVLYTSLTDPGPIEPGVECQLKFTSLLSEFGADYSYITNLGQTFYFITNRSAPNYKVIAIDLGMGNSVESNWKIIVDESPNEVLEWAFRIADDKLMVCYIKDVKHILRLLKLEDGTTLNSIEMDVGSITGRSGKRFLSEMFFKFETFVKPGKIFRLDVANPDFKPEIFREVTHPGFDSSEFETQQVFYNSKDGTKIPMFLVHRKGLHPNGNHFCRLYGYGGFNIAKMPTFFAPRIAMLDMFDGVFALANIRGGGEYGNTWYESGAQFKKQNGFDDFQAAAEYLIENKFTNPSRLVIQGGSNGGLLVAACINQRPDLFAAAIIQVGVLDMLRFHKFTVGYGWTSDYGCSSDKNHFENLEKYSPLHNVKIPEGESIQYPATLLLTADHDDRVVPSHSFKFISELQHQIGKCSKQTNPLMLRVQTNVGHGSGKSLSKVIDEYTDIISFLFQSMDVSFKVRLH